MMEDQRFQIEAINHGATGYRHLALSQKVRLRSQTGWMATRVFGITVVAVTKRNEACRIDHDR